MKHFFLIFFALAVAAFAQTTEVITPTITVSTSIYSANMTIGGKLVLTNALRTSGAPGILQSIQLIDRANQKPQGTILIFNADPTAATITDHTAFTASTDDFKVVATIPIVSSDWVTLGTASKAFANPSNLGRVVKAASGRTLWATFITSSTPTFAATTDVQIAFAFLRD